VHEAFPGQLVVLEWDFGSGRDANDGSKSSSTSGSFDGSIIISLGSKWIWLDHHVFQNPDYIGFGAML